ncbi:hypothetical protein cyc_01433 [Cyclospora cayetanensis]|uniref:Uncharacterized protein n=1 Tax=Cyclospora cayetanensis TaxID=88456 RepID=A0A1D3D5T7_9EIME|nr:hypothetical protein cyc_01433 [Cyclospora cayetanensis]
MPELPCCRLTPLHLAVRENAVAAVSTRTHSIHVSSLPSHLQLMPKSHTPGYPVAQAKALLFSREAEEFYIDVDAEDLERKTPAQMAQTKPLKDMLQRYKQSRTKPLLTPNE